jgi:hypothetical protein
LLAILAGRTAGPAAAHKSLTRKNRGAALRKPHGDRTSALWWQLRGCGRWASGDTAAESAFAQASAEAVLRKLFAKLDIGRGITD